jgi:hypothetical protein
MVLLLGDMVSSPSHAKKLAEGANFVSTERSSGSGRLGLPSAKAPPAKKGGSMNPLWGGLLGAMKKKHSEESEEALSTIDSLRRLEGLLDKLDHGNMMSRVPRTPARELEHILGALNPIEHGLLEPYRRFEAGVNAVEKQLLSRDLVTDDRLAAIRAAINRTLERGSLGALAPLEREVAAAAKAAGVAPPAAAVGSGDAEGADEAAVGAPAVAASDAPAADAAAAAAADATAAAAFRKEREQILAEREGAEGVMSQLMMGTYARQGEREALLGGLGDWLDTAADDLIDALGAVEDMADAPLGGGQVESGLGGKGTFKSKQAFDAELLIERGRSQLDLLLNRLEDGATRALEMHEQLASGLRGKIWSLEVRREG